jgi:hypothetical protein
MKKRNFFLMVLPSIILVLSVFNFNKKAAAQPAKPDGDHWDGLRAQIALIGKLPYYLRVGTTYNGGTDGQPQVFMLTLGQSFPLPSVVLGYTFNLGLRKQSFEGLEGKELGPHLTFEYERFRLAASVTGQAVRLPWGEILPIVTYILRGQGAVVKSDHSDHFELFLGGELFGRNKNFDLGVTAGFRFKRLQVFGREIDAVVSVTDMTAFATPPGGIAWTNYLVLRGGLIFDVVPPEDNPKKEDRPREYGQL